MILQIEVNTADAKATLAFLNADGGLRNAVADKLIPQNKPENVAKLASVVSGLAAISRGLSLALDAEAQFEADYRASQRA